MKYIWIIGSPRSGTTFLCDYIGKYVDKVYNEPWKTHPLSSPHTWKFPKCDTVLMKYCENWRNLRYIMDRWPDSYFIHMWRDPDNVVYSMAYPKEKSYPPRNLYIGKKDIERKRLSMKRWYDNLLRCIGIGMEYPNRYHEIQYEDIQLDKLSVFLGISLKEKLKFNNRNIAVDLAWEEPYWTLRNIVKRYDFKSSLLGFLYKEAPNLIQRRFFI